MTRFAELSEDDLASLLDQKNSKKTKKAKVALIMYLVNTYMKGNWRGINW